MEEVGNDFEFNYEYFIILYDKLFQKLKDFDKILNEKNINSTIEITQKEIYKNFIDWLKINNADFNQILDFPVSFGPFKTVGVSSKIDIKENQSFVFIPNNLIINSEEIKSEKILFPIFEEFNEIRDSCLIVLTIYIISEFLKGDESFFKPYLDLVNVDNPLFWPSNLLNLIDDEGIILSIETQKEEIRDYFDKIKLLLQNENIISKNNMIKQFSFEFLSRITFEKFMTFYSFVESRNFMLNDDVSLLIPFADSFNHSSVSVYYEFFDSINFISKFTTKFDEDMVLKLNQTNHDLFLSLYNNSNIQYDEEREINLTDSIDEKDSIIDLKNGNNFFTISSGNKQFFSKNTQIFNFYGNYSNEALFVSYGFVKLLNKYDKIKFNIKYEIEEDILFAKLLKYYFGKLISEDENFIEINLKLKGKKINTKFLKLIRVLILYEESEKEDLTKLDNEKEIFDFKIEIQVIDRAIEIISSTFFEKSKRYEISEDLIDMNDILLREINSNKSNSKETDEELTNRFRVFSAISFRISQKFLLLFHLRYLMLTKEILLQSIRENIHIYDSFHQLYPKFEKNEEEFRVNRKVIKNYFLKNKLLNK